MISNKYIYSNMNNLKLDMTKLKSKSSFSGVANKRINRDIRLIVSKCNERDEQMCLPRSGFSWVRSTKPEPGCALSAVFLCYTSNPWVDPGQLILPQGIATAKQLFGTY